MTVRPKIRKPAASARPPVRQRSRLREWAEAGRKIGRKQIAGLHNGNIGLLQQGLGRLRGDSPLVPPHSVSRRALLALVAIMSFLACLSITAVSIINHKADGWQRQIADEVTIQIRPVGTHDHADAVARAVEIATQTPGVQSAVPLSDADSAALLEPWLGRDFDRKELPIPRLVAVSVSSETDLGSLARRLRDNVPGASLDDHGLWLERLSSMSNTVTFIGLFVTCLVFAATALSVIFATRGAMAGNRDVIEVLHFVGAEDIYIANQFQRHFLALGLKGAAIGGMAAISFMFIASLIAGSQGSTPEEAQIRSLFGGFNLDWSGFFAALLTVIATGVLIAVTARLTVYATLRKVD
ncbi:MAG TPA: ABC transporter permease [Afifellaceae bacterium]|nr:ABC transporter permease [Afifellaceae bacterium]